MIHTSWVANRVVSSVALALSTEQQQALMVRIAVQSDFVRRKLWVRILQVDGSHVRLQVFGADRLSSFCSLSQRSSSGGCKGEEPVSVASNVVRHPTRHGRGGNVTRSAFGVAGGSGMLALREGRGSAGFAFATGSIPCCADKHTTQRVYARTRCARTVVTVAHARVYIMRWTNTGGDGKCYRCSLCLERTLWAMATAASLASLPSVCYCSEDGGGMERERSEGQVVEEVVVFGAWSILSGEVTN